MGNYKLFTTWNTVDTYIRQAEAAPDQIEACWDETVVAPLWNGLAKWAPFDVSFMKPKAVRGINKLKTQNALLKQLDLDGLENSIRSIIRALPQLDADSFSIALFPAGDDPPISIDARTVSRGQACLGTSSWGSTRWWTGTPNEFPTSWLTNIIAVSGAGCGTVKSRPPKATCWKPC